MSAPESAISRAARWGDHPVIRLVIAPIGSLALAWFAWWAIVVWGHVSRIVACTPNQAFDAITQNWSSVWPLTWSTLKETAYGLVAGTACGLVLAYVMSRLRLVEILLYPPIITSQAVPAIALAPILVLIFGFTLTPIVLIVALFVFFPITINTLTSLRAVDRELLNLTKVLGASRWRRFALIEAPSALPGFFSGLRIGSVYAVSGAIIGQIYDTTNGNSLAFHQRNAADTFNTPVVYGDTMIMTILSLVVFVLAVALGHVATPWTHRDVAPRWSRAGRTGLVESPSGPKECL